MATLGIGKFLGKLRNLVTKVVDIVRKKPVEKKSPHLKDKENSTIAEFGSIRLIKIDGKDAIEADGKTYTLFQFSRSFKIKFSTLYGRVKKGYDIKDIIKSVRKVDRDYSKTSPIKAKLWEWNGEKHTVKEWAKIYGVKTAMMRKRLIAHGSPERNTEKLDAYKANRSRKFEWNGETHTVKEWAKIFNCPERTMFGRIGKYGSPEKRESVIPAVAKKWEFNGESHTVLEWAKILGKGETTIRTNLRKYGIPVNGNVNTNVKKEEIQDKNPDLYWCDGESKTLKEWANELGQTEEETLENFTVYGSPTVPAYDGTEEEEIEDAESEGEIDKIISDIDRKPEFKKPRESIKEAIRRIRYEPDDDKPLKDILSAPPRGWNALDGIVSNSDPLADLTTESDF